MSNRPTKRAKKAPVLIQRGAHVETSTSRGIRVRNVGIGPAPSVSISRADDQPALPSFQDFEFNAAEQMDFTLPTYEEVRKGHGKVFMLYVLSRMPAYLLCRRKTISCVNSWMLVTVFLLG